MGATPIGSIRNEHQQPFTMVSVLTSQRGGGFGFMSANYIAFRLSNEETVAALRAGYRFTNIGLEGGKVKGTNGALDRYSIIDLDTKALVSHESFVVLNRIHNEKDQLIGFTVCNPLGIVQELGLKDSVMYCKGPGFSNGKLKTATDGSESVSSIAGNYEYRTVSIKEASKNGLQAVRVQVALFITALNSNTKDKVSYAGMMLGCDNSAKLSEIYAELKADNERLVAAVEKLGMPRSELSSLRIIRVGNEGFYGVYSLQTALKIIKEYAGGSVSSYAKSIMVTSLDVNDLSNETVAFYSEMKNKKFERQGSQLTEKMAVSLWEQLIGQLN